MARFRELLVGPGTCDKSGCGRRRWRLSDQHPGHSNYCQQHSCPAVIERMGFMGVCRGKKGSSDPFCETHMRFPGALNWAAEAQARAAAAEDRRWTEHVAWSAALCSEDGCARSRHGSFTTCARHAGFCGRADCVFMRLEDSDWCATHQVCLHGECERPALVLCVPRGLGGGSSDSPMEVHGSSRFCAAHKACGAPKMLLEEEDGGEGGGWEYCVTPVGIGEAACQEHRCAVDGCKEKKAAWHDRPNAYCLLHTCAIGGCKKPTPNTAADRKHRFCKKHTCRRDGCSRRSFREDRRFPFCERHTCRVPECPVEVVAELGYCMQHFARATAGDFEAAAAAAAATAAAAASRGPASTRSVSAASSRWTDEDAAGRGRDPAPRRPATAELHSLVAAIDPADAEWLGHMLLGRGQDEPRPERRRERRHRRREDSAAPRNSPPIPDPQSLETFVRVMAAALQGGGGRR